MLNSMYKGRTPVFTIRTALTKQLSSIKHVYKQTGKANLWLTANDPYYRNLRSTAREDLSRLGICP